MSFTGCDFPAPRRSSSPWTTRERACAEGCWRSPWSRSSGACSGPPRPSPSGPARATGCARRATSTSWHPVILDTQDRLFLTDGIVKETALPAQEDARFKFRYRGLRLLIHGDGKLFLVPEKWSPSDSTLLVPLDDSVRVQFRFVNRAP